MGMALLNTATAEQRQMAAFVARGETFTARDVEKALGISRSDADRLITSFRKAGCIRLTKSRSPATYRAVRRPKLDPEADGSSTDEQRLRRPFHVARMRGVDPDTGETVVDDGRTILRFATHVEALAATGFLENRHVIAAEHWEYLSRQCLGSPSPRDCLDLTPAGDGGGPEPNRAAAEQYRRLRARMKPHEREELDRVVWRGCHTRRPLALRSALNLVSDEIGG